MPPGRLHVGGGEVNIKATVAGLPSPIKIQNAHGVKAKWAPWDAASAKACVSPCRGEGPSASYATKNGGRNRRPDQARECPPPSPASCSRRGAPLLAACKHCTAGAPGRQTLSVPFQGPPEEATPAGPTSERETCNSAREAPAEHTHTRSPAACYSCHSAGVECR